MRRQKSNGTEHCDHADVDVGTTPVESQSLTSARSQHNRGADNQIHDDHHDGVDGISADLRSGRGAKHHGGDQHDLNHQHGDRENQRTIWLPEALRKRICLFQHAKGRKENRAEEQDEEARGNRNRGGDTRVEAD